MQPPDGMSSVTTYAFLLREGEHGLEIDLSDTTVTTGKGGHGRSVGAGPYPQPLDVYAPEAMKPILARWRHLIAEGKAGASAPKGQISSATPLNLQVEAKTGATPIASSGVRLEKLRGKWEDGTPFVDLPKGMIGAFRIAGLTVDDELSPAARALFGL